MPTPITVIQKSAAFFLQPLFPVILPASKPGTQEGESLSQRLQDIQRHGEVGAGMHETKILKAMK